jgi:hypothetical protein
MGATVGEGPTATIADTPSSAARVTKATRLAISIIVSPDPDYHGLTVSSGACSIDSKFVPASVRTVVSPENCAQAAGHATPSEGEAPGRWQRKGPAAA